VLEAHRIADEVTLRVKERFEEISHILVHIDPYTETDTGEANP
jgi:divalent metal cation (Fe/Co/Zn/Cd) transporter